jgi:hypothetical protein
MPEVILVPRYGRILVPTCDGSVAPPPRRDADGSLSYFPLSGEPIIQSLAIESFHETHIIRASINI